VVGGDVRTGAGSRALGELCGSPVGAQGQYACSRMSRARLGTHILWRCVPKHTRLHFARGACGFVSGKKIQKTKPRVTLYTLTFNAGEAGRLQLWCRLTCVSI